MLLIIWSDDTFSIFDPPGQAFDSFITFLTVVVLSWSLVCLLIFSFAEKLPQCGTTRSMVRPMDKPKVCHMFSPNSGLISFSETFLAWLFRIPYSRASILSLVCEVLQEVSIHLDDVDLQWSRNLPQYRPPCLLSVSMMRDFLPIFWNLWIPPTVW